MINIKKYFPLSVAFLVGVILTQAISYIYAQEANLIHGCVRPAGFLRIIDANETCNANETPLTWNIQGPTGPAGPMGPTGATGSEGGGGSLIGVFGGYTTDQLVGMDTINEPFIYRYFVGGNFSGSYFAETMQASNFSQTNLTNTLWAMPIISSNFTQADFSNSTLQVQDTNSNFTSANLSNVNFDSSEFTDTNFTNANFTNADLEGVTFTNTIMTDAIWSNTTCPDGTNSDNNGNTCEGHLIP